MSSAPEPERAPPHTRGRALEGLHILVVDDHIGAVESLSFLLELEGARVLGAGSGAAALELAAKARRIDLLLSDIGMPGMDGYELVAALHALPAFATLPAIALSGFGSSDDGGRALAAGFVDQLTKPVGIERLVEAMRRVLPADPASI